MPEPIQKGSFNAAVGLPSYVPSKYQVPNLRTEYTDRHGVRTNISYEKAVVLPEPEKIYTLYQSLMANGQDLTESDINRAVENGKAFEVIRQIPGGALIYNELCPMDEPNITRYDFETLFTLINDVKKSLEAKGGSLADIALIVEEPFFGVDLRKTEYASKNPNAAILRSENYPNHHMINRIRIAPRENRGTFIYYPSIANPANIPVGKGSAGIVINQDPGMYQDESVKKKKTVSEPAREYQILEEIRKLGGAQTIHDGNFKGKDAELTRLVNTLQLKDLVSNDTVTGMKGLADARIHDLSLAHAILGQVILQKLQNKVFVDFFENMNGVNGRHVISSALIYEKTGYLGITENFVRELTPSR